MRMPRIWEDCCVLRDRRGDGSIPRIKYRNGEILLMSPLPRHGREAQSDNQYFPTVDLPVLIDEVLQIAAEQGTRAALRQLRQRLVK